MSDHLIRPNTLNNPHNLYGFSGERERVICECYKRTGAILVLLIAVMCMKMSCMDMYRSGDIVGECPIFK